ncbi:unnamed protein product, partial [Heterotrigona itama]
NLGAYSEVESSYWDGSAAGWRATWNPGQSVAVAEKPVAEPTTESTGSMQVHLPLLNGSVLSIFTTLNLSFLPCECTSRRSASCLALLESRLMMLLSVTDVMSSVLILLSFTELLTLFPSEGTIARPYWELVGITGAVLSAALPALKNTSSLENVSSETATSMLNTMKTSLRRSVQHSSRIVQLNKIENKTSVSKPLPVFRYSISDERDHRVYVWGLADHGALGTLKTTMFDKGISYIPKPKRLVFGERHDVTNITCGYGFTAFAVRSKDKNILYGSGINTDSQLGKKSRFELIFTYSISVELLLDARSKSSLFNAPLGFNEMDKRFPNSLITEPRPINLPVKDSSAKVLDMAAGRAHLLVLTNEGLFTLGNNAYGQCGRPIIPNENYEKSRVIHHISDIKEKKVKAVTAGQDHSVLLTESGEVYTFGWGADGQTGLAHYRNEYRPSLVKGDLAGQHIIKIACVADCVLALSEVSIKEILTRFEPYVVTDKGTVFGWGNSEYAQLFMEGENQQVNIATELDVLKQLGHIVDIASGGCFCMVLNNTGDVYVWGYGILGLGPEVKKVSQPTKIPSVLFGNNAYQKNTKVVKIFCGMSHLAALTNMGDLYMWGCNKFGSLGLGDLKDQYFPLK